MDRSTYAPGATIIAALVVHNRSDTILTLSFTSGQRYDFAVQDAAGTVHWRWGAERGFIQALGEETLGPQDTLRYTERIDAPRARGRYTLVGTVTARDHVGRASATFLVE